MANPTRFNVFDFDVVTGPVPERRPGPAAGAGRRDPANAAPAPEKAGSDSGDGTPGTGTGRR